ncbi:MAG: ABC transporter permease [Desulfobacca sp.]|uniref:ABC transporter permease n=1 Tax=Desulfobacca sp. TaxID=2067990 RepID=UPI0040493850
MRDWFPIYWREVLILRRRLLRQLASMSVAPILYLLAFGVGIGGDVTVQGRPYLEFLIPGLIAMNSMMQSFAIAIEINVARFYWGIFEEFQAAPISDGSYVLGETLAGITRALLSVSVIIIVALVAGIHLTYNLFFWTAVLLTAFFFAALAIALAMVVKSHADQALLTSFVITPMAFLSGTFFPLENMPGWVKPILRLLPLTPATEAIRAAAYGQVPSWRPYLILTLLAVAAFLLAVNFVKKARD